MAKVTIPKFTVGYSDSQDHAPEFFIPASVPGSVQRDLERAGGFGPIERECNCEKYVWAEDCFWFYRTRVSGGKNRFLVCGGIDYRYLVRLNGETVLEYEGMNRGFRLPLEPEDCEVEIVVFPAPKVKGERERDEARESFKPPVSYGWDFHPHLIQLGIWRECRVEEPELPEFTKLEVTYDLAEDFSGAAIRIEYETNHSAELAGEVQTEFRIGGVQVRGENGTALLNLRNPRLWYPRGYGEPFLYDLVCSVSADGKTFETVKKLGIRRVRLVTKPRNWGWEGNPATQALPPITLEVNGKAVFAKGTNYVTPKLFTAEMTDEDCEKYVGLIFGANMNTVRCWGGSSLGRRRFYEECDRLGILVWQEFPLACNCYPDSPGYLEVLGRESEVAVKFLREFACVSILCGGNELYMSWSGMTEQSLSLRRLNAVCLEHAPHIPYLMTSPLYGMRHGAYNLLYSGEEPFLSIRRLDATAYTEFGVPSVSSAECLDTFLPKPSREYELAKLLSDKVWRAHHGSHAADKEPDSWTNLPDIEKIYGKITSVSELSEVSQILQAIAYKGIYEQIRRMNHRCSMALNWDFCDCWQTAANNSIVEFGGKPKLAYYAIADSLKDQTLSFEYETAYCVQDKLSGRLYTLCDGLEKAEAFSVRVCASQNEKRAEVSGRIPEAEKCGENACGDCVALDISGFEDGFFELTLSAEGNPAVANTYVMLKKSGGKQS